LQNDIQNSEDLIMKIVQDFSSRLRDGQRPKIDNYVEQYPDLGEMIRDTLAAVKTMIAMDPDDVRPVAGPDGEKDECSPRQLGDFRIIREIGRGGMGVVYEAEQISLGRKVALKLLPYAAMLDSRRLQRFKNEAHAAASLHHNNIVSVFAIGSERGVHFYTMQLIEGQTLAQIIYDLQSLDRGGQSGSPTDATRESLASDLAGGKLSKMDVDEPVAQTTLAVANLSTKGSAARTTYYRSIAKLMEQACDALDYAHQQGVIHRDIKPSNLIVDADWRIWVTDFGLAQMECDAQITVTGDIVGTLRYMSPEQALAKRVTIDHRTDIYSLGATLYELLTLQPVVAGDNRQQVLRGIAFDQPRKPRRVRPSIPTDLETIALKALEKSPDYRYQSAREMANDLSRYLNHEPIRAKQPNLGQRMAKWSRRHPAVIPAALLLMLFVAIGSTVSAGLIWQANRRTQRALQSEKTAAQSAERRATENKAVIDFLVNDLLAATAPEVSAGRNLTVQEVLANAEKKIDGEFGDFPLVEASIRHAMGKAYYSLGEYSTAQRHLHRANQIRVDNLGFDNVETLRSSLDEAKAIREQGRFDEARLLMEKVVADQTKVLPPFHRDILRTKSELAITFVKVEQLNNFMFDQEAQQVLRELKDVITLQRRELGPADTDTLDSTQYLGNFLTKLKEFKEAIEISTELAITCEQTLGTENPRTLSARHGIAVALANSGKREESAKLFADLVDSYRRVFGPENPSTLSLMQNLANVEPDIVKKQRRYEEVLNILKRVRGGHPKTIWCMGALAMCLREQGKLDDAKRQLRDAVQLALETDGKHTSNSILCVLNLGDIETQQGRHAEAITHYLEALEVYRSLHGPLHAHTIVVLKKIVGAYDKLGRLSEGGVYLSELLQILESRIKEPDANDGDYNNLADAMLTDALPYKDYYDPQQALEYAQKACKLAESNEQAALWMCLDTLASAQHQTGNTASAVETQKRAISLMPEDAPQAQRAEVQQHLRALEDSLDGASRSGTSPKK
jgi:serine/threonine protein kinase/lipopolysaccharide biosynthesis regulator YciM